jgi:hypothetical protein
MSRSVYFRTQPYAAEWLLLYLSTDNNTSRAPQDVAALRDFYLIWVGLGSKTRSHLFRAYVGFHQLRTCRRSARD